MRFNGLSLSVYVCGVNNSETKSRHYSLLSFHAFGPTDHPYYEVKEIVI